MNKTTYLGEFEHMILLAILRLGDQAYGMSIRDELEERAGREVTRSAAYYSDVRRTLRRSIGCVKPNG